VATVKVAHSGCVQRGTNELSHSSLCRWSQSPPLPKRSERDCRGSGGERSAGALRLPGRLARCGTSRMRSTPWRCHSPWNCWQAMTVSNHVVWNRSSKISVGWSVSKTVEQPQWQCLPTRSDAGSGLTQRRLGLPYGLSSRIARAPTTCCPIRASRPRRDGSMPSLVLPWRCTPLTGSIMWKLSRAYGHGRAGCPHRLPLAGLVPRECLGDEMRAA
jgi:hypothetical protein